MTKIISLCLLIGCIPPASADIWHDDFDVENPDAWHIVGNAAVWTVEDGFLRARVQREWELQYELYQFHAFPAPYRHFTVTINNFGGDKARFGFTLGKNFPDTPFEDPFFYVFFTDEIRARRFNGKGSSHPFEVRVSKEPRIRWDTEILTKMELRFNVGDFQLFANGELRAEFQDANFDQIEILGFVMEGINIANEWVAEAWADSFTISGPTLNVSDKQKLATMWGELKK